MGSLKHLLTDKEITRPHNILQALKLLDQQQQQTKCIIFQLNNRIDDLEKQIAKLRKD
jgi:hypothetical protein